MLCATLASSGPARAAGIWETEFMTAPPARVLAAAKDATSQTGGVVVLFEERVHTLEEGGRGRARYRQVYRIQSEQALDEWGHFGVGWSPWHQDRPELRARVVTAAGRTHVLDPKTVEASAVPGSGDVYTDRQSLRAPLRGAAVGSVVEIEIVSVDRAPLFAAGTFHRFFFGGDFPVLRTRLVLDVPASLPLRHVIRNLPGLAPAVTESGGRRTIVFDGGPYAAVPDPVPGQPAESYLPGYVGYTTAQSWGAIAAAYGDLVDRQIGKPDLRAVLGDAAPARAGAGKADREATIRRVVARLGAEVKYTGIEFGDASLVPRTPAEILERRYGDCKDKALLLTAALRGAGVPAQVALLSAGFEADVDPDLPGMGWFDHAIVYVPGPKPLWIDATDRFSALGELPLGDQGRLALVTGRGQTGLVRTPSPVAAANSTREERTVTVSEDGAVKVVERSDMTGAGSESLRDDYSRNERADVEKQLLDYVKETYQAKTLARFEHSDAYDVDHPLHLDLETTDAGIARVDDQSVEVTLPMAAVFSELPESLRDPAAAARKHHAPAGPRTLDYVYHRPYVYELRYRVTPPHGFAADPPPPDDNVTLGPARYSESYRAERDGAVSATIRFDSGKPRLSPAELEAFRTAMTKLSASPVPVVKFHQIGEAHLAAGRVREALAEFRRLDAEHPRTVLHATQVVTAYLRAGLGGAARAEARRAVEIDPKSTLAQRFLGWVLEHDLVGRRLKPGCDRQGAEKAYRRALELDAGDDVARASLAILLEHDASGEHVFRSDRIDEVLAMHRALRKAGLGRSYAVNYMADLLYAERFKEVLAEKGTLGDDLNVRAIYLAALAATSGAPAAINEASRLVANARDRFEALRMGGGELLRLRRYPAAAALFDAAAVGHESSPALRLLADRLRRTRRWEEMGLDDRKAADAAKMFVSALFGVAEGAPKAYARLQAVASPALLAHMGPAGPVQRGFRQVMAASQGGAGMSLASMGDVLISLGVALDGKGPEVQRVTWTGDGQISRGYVLIMAREADRWRAVGFNNDLEPVGQEVLRLLDAGDLLRARLLLDAAVTGGSLGEADEPLSGSLLARMWRKGGAGGAAEARLAAFALIASGTGAGLALEPLAACAAKPPSEAVGIGCALGLMAAREHQGLFGEAADVARSLEAAYPDSKEATAARIRLLARAGREGEVRDLLEKRLRASPDKPELKLSLAHVLSVLGDARRAEALLVEEAKKSGASGYVHNELAWLRLLRGQADEETVSIARRAAEATQRRAATVLHTLAAALAEANRPEEAYRTLLEEMDRAGSDEPTSVEWYVLGRIAEGYGAVEPAREAYARVERPRKPGPQDTWNLVDRRLKLLPGPDGRGGAPAVFRAK